MRAVLLALVLVGCAPHDRGPSEPAPCEPSSPSERAVHWRDEAGRVLVYRGVNLSGAAKYTADLLPPVGADDFARLHDWGATAVRLLFFWQGVEPEQGTYDLTYLEGLRQLADRAGDAGLAVILDPHQDVYGEGFGFAGFPDWTCDSALYATFTRPSSWYLSYLQPEVVECFDRFWSSEDLQSAYASAMAKVVEVVGASSSVVALELMNEPWSGSYSSDLFEQHALRPFYDRVAEAVRAVRPNLWLLAEPAVIYNLGLGTKLEAPFGCPTYLFAPHFYPAYTESGDYDGDIEGLRALLSPARQHANALGAPLVVTELGTRTGPGSVAFLRDTLVLLDELWASGLVWDYGPGQAFALVDPSGVPTPEAEAVVRPYVHRLAGEPGAQHWDPSARVFSASWHDAEPMVLEPTEIILPPALFDGDLEVTLSDGHWQRTGRRLLVWTETRGEHQVSVQAL